MSVAGFGDLPDRVSLTDEPPRQFACSGSAFGACEEDSPTSGRVAASLDTFPHEVAFKLGNPSEATEEAAGGP